MAISSTRLRRFALQMGLIGFVLAGALFGLVSMTNSMQPDNFIEVTVAPGDTLWKIATQVTSGKDPRSVIYDIKKYNGLESGFLKVGQVLQVPLYE